MSAPAIESTEQCAARYRFLRSLALNPSKGLEAFVAINQLDHTQAAERFDAAIDEAMQKAKT
jgi:hypothetical protein